MIHWIEVEGVRNLETQRMELGPGLTVIAGKNAQGKSSFLESVYVLGTTRSFRTARVEEAVRHEQASLTVRGEITSGPAVRRLAVRVGKGLREVRRDGEPTTLDRYLGLLDVVAMSSASMRVMAGAPEERRRFLDRGAALLRPAYLRDLRDFRRALAQRNRLLKELSAKGTPPSRSGELLRPWNAAFSAAASSVSEGRRDFAEALSETLTVVPEKLLPERAQMTVAYRPGPGYDARDPEAYRAALSDRLEHRVAEEIRLGYTVAGPQRDELTLRSGGQDLLTYGSSGQQRAAMIALLLAQMELIRERRGGYPVLLVDDVDSDIDEARFAALMGSLGEGFQALVATSKGSLPGADVRGRFVMRKGRAEVDSPEA